MLIRESIQFNGKEVSLETGRLAKQTNGAVLATYGDTRVLVTVGLQESNEDIDYFPLRVDYEERFYASGKIPGGFFKREGRPSDVAILSARMIDRPIRPLFPKDYQDEVQIVATILSAEPDCSPSIVGILGASAALVISEAPFAGPIAGVKVGQKDGQLVVNPEATWQEEGGVEITVAGTKETVTMVEGIMDELSEEKVVEAIDIAHRAIQDLVSLQERFVERVRPVKKEVSPTVEDPELRERVRAIVWPEFPSMYNLSSKKERQDFVESICERAIQAIVMEDVPAEEKAQLKKKAVVMKLQKGGQDMDSLNLVKRNTKRQLSQLSILSQNAMRNSLHIIQSLMRWAGRGSVLPRCSPENIKAYSSVACQIDCPPLKSSKLSKKGEYPTS